MYRSDDSYRKEISWCCKNFADNRTSYFVSSEKYGIWNLALQSAEKNC